MKYIDVPVGSFVDRMIIETSLEPIDVIMPTLDAASFLEKCLYTIYREVPVRKLFVCDGGSRDETIEILKKFPRIEISVRPDIRTTGKVLEFLMSLIETEWFLLIDSDIELERGWYDEMHKNQTSYDVLENSRRTLGYHFFREDKLKLESSSRSFDMCHLVKKKVVKKYYCDDDFMWRYTDYFLRQVVEKSGFRYGKIDSTSHVHNETEGMRYESDNEKNFQKMIWEEPSLVVTDKKKSELFLKKHAKAIVKYLDPDHPVVHNNKGLNATIRGLDRKWVSENGPKWLPIYDKVNSWEFSIKNFIYRNFLNKTTK